MLLGERGSRPTEDRAERSHSTPITQRILTRRERVILDVVRDRVPELVNVALKVLDIAGLRIECDDLPGLEVHELHTRGQHLRARQEERVEAHLVQRFVDIAGAGRLSGLVIDDP